MKENNNFNNQNRRPNRSRPQGNRRPYHKNQRSETRNNSWLNKYSIAHNFGIKNGQALGFIYNILFLGLISYLIFASNEDLALKLFAINAILIAFVIVFSTLENIIHRIISNKRFSQQIRNPSSSSGN